MGIRSLMGWVLPKHYHHDMISRWWGKETAPTLQMRKLIFTLQVFLAERA